MFTCERLTVETDSAVRRPVLNNLSGSIEAGRVRAIVGGPGSGKSVLGDALRGVLGPGLRHAAGRVRVGEVDLLDTASAGRVTASPVAWCGEETEAEMLAAQSVGDGLRTALVARFPGTVCDDLMLVAALARVGINDARVLDRDPATLLPALRRRLAMAQALARPTDAHPARLVVLDEPLGGLDAVGVAEVLASLAGMRRTTRAAVVVLTRDLALAQRFADEISVLEGGQIVETFYPERTMSAPLGLSGPAGRGGSRYAAGRRQPGSAQRRALQRGDDRPQLELREYSVLLANGSQAASPLTLRVDAGETLAITGPSGSGKS
ncbi:MAG: ATP-binding cassette domain-containing protein, partial [Leucobacter sp.]|nr:ATP-binding cassette domain-containing protein [Leucobacter sp.]